MACNKNSCTHQNNLINSKKNEEPAFFINNDQPKSKVKKSQIFFNYLRRSLSFRRKSNHQKSRKVLDIPTRSLNSDREFSTTDLNNQEHILKKEPPLCLQENDCIRSQHEEVYCSVLNSLIHPLGTPDMIFGLRPGDLTDYLRTAFNINQEDHEVFIKELNNKPTNLHLNVTVLEAKASSTYRIPDHDPPWNAYCSIKMVNTSRARISPAGSPKSSPKSRRAKTEQISGLNTQMVKSISGLQWNEKFELEIESLLTDELHISVYLQDNNPKPETSSKSTQERIRNLKSLLQFSRLSDQGKGMMSLGSAVLPLRDISNVGEDRWVDLSISAGRLSKTTRIVGIIRVQLSISLKKVICITEGYLKAKQKLYFYAGQKSGTNTIDTLLSQHSERILDIFAVAHKVSKLSQMMVQLIVLLEIANGSQRYKVTDTALHKAIKALHMAWSTMQPPAGQVMEEIESRMPLTDTEISMFRSAATDYIRSMMPKIKTGPEFYPLEANHFRKIESNMGIITQLLELDLWEENPPIKEQLSTLVMNKLKNDITKWLLENIESISCDGVLDNILDEISNLSDVLNHVITHCTPVNVIITFFKIFNINYYNKISIFVDNKISMKAKELMLEMNRYQLRYYKFPENITNSSKVSLNLYTTLRKLYNILKCNLCERELFLVTLGAYQTWFQETLMYWLTTFKVECQNRLTKALEIDKDIVLVTSLLKFSNSSVDVLSCFTSITMEWREIDIADPDTAVMGVTKITDFICDCVKLYADKIHMTLKNNGYYDEQENHFDITDQLCITLNNIEHVKAYLKNLEHELEWEKTADAMGSSHESEEIQQQVLTTLHRLTQNCCSDINLKSRMLVTEIVERMKVDMNKRMATFIRNWKALSSSVDLKNYLQSNMDTLRRRLQQSVYPLFIEELWETVIELMQEQVVVGHEAEYYQTLHTNVRNLRTFFLGHLDQRTDLQTDAYRQLEEYLTINSEASEELMLKYFAELNQDKRTPDIDYGHIAVIVAYLLETRGYVTIFVKVINGTNLPGLDSTGLSDPYVILALQPRYLFKELKPKRTKTVFQNLNPVFNASFQFNNIPQECLTTPGATIHLLVYDQDKLLRDDFAGEATIALSSIPKLNDGSCTTFEKTPTTILSLKRPEMTSRSLQVLQERIPRDNVAKDFVQERLRVIENQRPRTDRALVRRPLTLMHAIKMFF